MKILFVTPVLPSATLSVSTRPFSLIRQMHARHEISVLSFLKPMEEALLSGLEPYCQRVELVPFSGFARVGKWRNRLDGWRQILFDSHPRLARTFPVQTMRRPLLRIVQELDPDLVYFEGLYLVELLPEIGDLPAVLGQQNAEFETVRKRLFVAENPIHKLRDRISLRKLRAFETYWVRQFSVCTAVSEIDKQLLQAVAPDTKFYVVPNGVDSEYFAPPNDPPPRADLHLVFVGTMDYGPNVDGVRFFCRQIWPLILKAVPDARLTIVGARPTTEVETLQSLPGVTITGYVDDVRPYFWEATASIVPLRIGSGTRLKILESLAAGCPVISTSIGAEGLDLRHGRDLHLADDPKDFAAGTIQLLTSPEYQAQLAIQGQQTVIRLYDWKTIAGQLETACLHAANCGTSNRVH